MPTDNDEVAYTPIVSLEPRRPLYSSCPPEDRRRRSWEPRGRERLDHDIQTVEDDTTLASQEQTPPAEDGQHQTDRRDGETPQDELQHHQMETDPEPPLGELAVPLTPPSECKDVAASRSTAYSYARRTDSSTLMGLEFSNVRLLPTTCTSRLRAGSKFEGTQQSESQVYDVFVDLKYVDMRESFLCGYLRIQGLTEDHPTLTTYFEGEIIGNKYTFQTRHPEWGSNEKVDMKHWDQFQAWRPLAKQAKKADFKLKDFTQRENIFMRWKEQFLVPNHTVRTIYGASFEGFYYICFNQIHGTISGIYFHAKSEKYQKLALKHIEDRGCSGAMEFR